MYCVKFWNPLRENIWFASRARIPPRLRPLRRKLTRARIDNSQKEKAAPWRRTTAQLSRLFDSLAFPRCREVMPTATRTAWTRWSTALSIFCWLKIREFDLLFLFLCPWFVLHVICSFHLFVVCPRSDVISVPSLMYCVKFWNRLRGKFGFLTEGNEEDEGFRSGGGQSLCFLCCLLFRIFACAASTCTAGSASTQRGGCNIYETASNQSRHAAEA
jgi:hypothetical protein